MTWRKDGSGLEVKRVRGMTLPQYTELAMRYWEEPNKRRAKRSHAAGLLSHVDHARRQIRFTRERRRDRRAKRQAKAAARRVARLMARINPLLRKIHEAESRAMSVRWSIALAFDSGGSAEALREFISGPAFMGGSIGVYPGQ